MLEVGPLWLWLISTSISIWIFFVLRTVKSFDAFFKSASQFAEILLRSQEKGVKKAELIQLASVKLIKASLLLFLKLTASLVVLLLPLVL